MPTDVTYKLGPAGQYYYRHQAIPKADVTSFQVLNSIWARDKKAVYSHGKPLRKANLATFTVLNHLFAKDKHQVFDPNGVLKGADAASFETLDDGYSEHDTTNSFGDVVRRHDEFLSYARDKTFVYLHVYTYRTRVLKNVDRGSFEVLKGPFGRDFRRVYYEGTQVKKADPGTFEPIGRMWGRDHKHAYYGTGVIEEADPATFALFDENEYLTRDAVHFYYQRTVAGPEHIAFDRSNRPLSNTLVGGLRLGIGKVTQYLAAGADPRREPLALQLACQYQDVAMVKLLLDHGADPNTRDRLDKEPVMTYAVYNKDPLPMVKLLLSAGADVNAGGGRMPLEAALVGGKWELAEFLVSVGADVNAQAHTGQRLLDYAKGLTSGGRVVQFLQDHGAI